MDTSRYVDIKRLLSFIVLNFNFKSHIFEGSDDIYSGAIHMTMTLRKTTITIICFLRLIYFVAGMDFVDGQTADKKNGTKMIRINHDGDGIIVDDLLECIEMLGQTSTEIGIPREVINTEIKAYIRTYVDGNIFGTKDYGILHFNEIGNDKDDYLAESIWIHVKHVGYDECKKRLSEKFGNPTGEGENPFVEVDGGAVKWTIYRFQDIEIRLSSASQRNYIEINIEKRMD